MEADHETGLVHLSDRELAALVNSGNKDAFSALSNRYLPALYGRADRYAGIDGVEVEDFVQEGLFALYRAVRGFDPGREAEFRTYATTCINNSMSAAIKRHVKLRGPLSVGEAADRLREFNHGIPAPFSAEQLCLEWEEFNQRALQIQATLSSFERRVLQLHLRGHSYKKISQKLSTATKAVDNALQRIRRKLRPLFPDTSSLACVHESVDQPDGCQ